MRPILSFLLVGSMRLLHLGSIWWPKGVKVMFSTEEWVACSQREVKHDHSESKQVDHLHSQYPCLPGHAFSFLLFTT